MEAIPVAAFPNWKSRELQASLASKYTVEKKKSKLYSLDTKLSAYRGRLCLDHKLTERYFGYWLKRMIWALYQLDLGIYKSILCVLVNKSVRHLPDSDTFLPAPPNSPLSWSPMLSVAVDGPKIWKSLKSKRIWQISGLHLQILRRHAPALVPPPDVVDSK